jgi:hypothetical protein
MTRFDVAVLAFRILALYFLFEVLRGLGQLVVILTHPFSEPIPALPWSLPLALVGTLGVLLLLKAPTLARRMFPRDEPQSSASRPEIGMLALKVCGILLLADGLSRSGQGFDRDGSWSASQSFGVLLPLVFGVLLFFTAPALSRRMFGAPVKPMAQALYAHVQAVTFAVLGIWLVVTSISSLVEFVRERVQLGEWGRGSWSQFALAALGLALFLGGTGLSAFWYWIRNAGVNAHPERPR